MPGKKIEQRANLLIAIAFFMRRNEAGKVTVKLSMPLAYIFLTE
jgi:hypothetical protein